MKRIRLEELLSEVRANAVAFLSIVMFICLGICFFVGIDWGNWALVHVAEQVLEAGSMHDVEVDYPYGVTEADIAQVKALAGITDAEPGYVAYATVKTGDVRSVFKVQSLTHRIDTPTVVEGSLPTQPDEVALLAFWAHDLGIEVGDTVVFEHDAQEESDEDGMSLLMSDSYVVSGLVEHPAYVSNVAGTLGNANVGSGRVDCVAFATDAAFDAEQFDDGYPILLVRCDGLRGLNTFGRAYQDELAPLVDAVAELGDKLGSARYNQLVDDAQAEIDEGRKQVADWEQKISGSTQQTASGLQQLAMSEGELAKRRSELEVKRDEAKRRLADAEERLSELDACRWVVLSRLENPGIYQVESMAVMMNNVRWAMASLFILVGLFVCYSAVSRLINDEAVQIGTKKALGYRVGQTAALYLSFSGLAVIVGMVLGGVIGAFGVEATINRSAAEPFQLPPVPLHASVPELLLCGSVELALIMAATWLAIGRLVRRDAVVLLNGNEEHQVRARFYERWHLWQSLSLYSQTIINNCINDKRRVVATLVGVAGCTSLIVTALTLSRNISSSIERQYGSVYSFDTVVRIDASVEGSADKASDVLDSMGLLHTAVHLKALQVRQPDGYRMGARLVVPDDMSAFGELYHLMPLNGGTADLSAGGVWLSAGYADHMGLGAGDTVSVTEDTGQTHELAVGGVFEYYNLENEFVMSAADYREAFGGDPTPNALFVQKGDADIAQVRRALAEVAGYESVSDDKAYSITIFGRITGLLKIVVVIYLSLSALMAVMVLLNLDVMFVDEKKRELLVLMINGFSTEEAKAYVYRDSLVLTAIGIVLGALLGSVVGNMTIGLLEPSFGYFIRGVNVVAVLGGATLAALFSVSMMLIALRRIPRFSLTDINRF